MNVTGTTEMTTNDVRAGLADVLNAAAIHGRITYVTNRGRRIAAVVPLSVAEEAAGRSGLTPAP